MINGDFQPDLFDEKTAKKRRINPISVLSRATEQHRVLPYFRVTTEQAIVGGIIVLVLFVAVFALGVESGRRLAYARISAKTNTRADMVPKAPTVSAKDNYARRQK